VIITQRMINANMKMFEQVWPFVVERPPVMIDWLPWSHVFGGNHNIGQVLRSGGTLYIDDGRPLAAEFERTLRNLRELSPTMYLNVPKGFELLAPALANDRDLRQRFFADRNPSPASLGRADRYCPPRAAARSAQHDQQLGVDRDGPGFTCAQPP
jgi:feruloyl-CoA synthase